ncbi:hypothetical protein ND856_18635 [Leptospira bandrabouensis]|uniref:hypothetical protein n=1 Tax=Leptospira bandrabouensis TaxID=2484903 RepID=UPI00223DC7CE|nr:hypothetical protein [Leptospira bandrabouensis]MCW7460159.1 hypothetical protein [Leptospira bandrabouensis]MCW7479324.1 hypothetical protein [Leptospira bandrabouensis]MCW7487006.1 hypothetical protein [Leptospira bandrabouensis]
MPELLVKEEKVTDFFEALECMKNPDADREKKLQACVKVNKAIAHFVERPKREMKKQLQAFKNSNRMRKLQAYNGGVSSGDLPSIVQDNISVLMDSDVRIDGAHKALFDFTQSVESLDYFEIATLSNGIKFKKLAEGEKVPMYGLKGDWLQVPIEKDGAALVFPEEVIKWKKIWRVISIVKEFRFANFKKEADDFGTLLKLAGEIGANNSYFQAFDSASGTNEEKTIRTLNAAYVKLTQRLKDRPYGDMVRPEVVLLASPLRSDVLDVALNTLIQPTAGSKLRINKPITVLYTWNEKLLPDPTKALMVLPGRRLQWTEQGTMQNYNYADPLTLTYASAYYNWHGEGIGDSDQVLTVNLT